MSTQIASQNQLSKSKVVAEKLASLILRAFIDEAIVKGIINPPKGVDYWASRTQLLNSNWIGSGRLVVDELKAAKASEIRMNNGLTTQQQECSDNGLDWQEVNDQRQYEELDRIARGLPPRIAESAFLDTKQELEGSNEQ
jgi:capsid protein